MKTKKAQTNPKFFLEDINKTNTSLKFPRTEKGLFEQII